MKKISVPCTTDWCAGSSWIGTPYAAAAAARVFGSAVPKYQFDAWPRPCVSLQEATSETAGWYGLALIETNATREAAEPRSWSARATSWARSVQRSWHSSSLKVSTTLRPRNVSRLIAFPCWSVRE
jgi:hypothetical protein